MAGVTVVVKGTSNGTVTDLNGTYQLQVNPEAKFLVFSYIGYETEEVKISRSNLINLTLQPSAVALEEVVSYEYDMASPNVGRVSGVPVRESSKSYHKRTYNQTYVASSYAPEPGYIQHNTEGYTAIDENGFKDVLHNPLSTFSIDVDRASYSNVRRFLNMGQLPPMDAVRIEEMINYFNYDYPEPEGRHPFSVYTEISACPWNASPSVARITTSCGIKR